MVTTVTGLVSGKEKRIHPRMQTSTPEMFKNQPQRPRDHAAPSIDLRPSRMLYMIG